MSRLQTLIENPQHKGHIIGVNPKRLNEIPYFLLTNRPNNTVNVAANQGSFMQVMMVSGQGPAALLAFGHQKTQDMRVFLQIQDGQGIRGLMNGACHIDTIFGSGAQPFYLPEALYIDELRSVQIAFTNLAAVDGEVRVSMLGKRYLTHVADPTMQRIQKRMENKQYLSNPYFYTLDEGPVTIPAGVGMEVQATITVGQDQHFDWMTASRVSTGRFNIGIIDANTGESVISAPQEVHYPIGDEIFFGTGNFPFRFHEPRMIQIGQRLLVRLINREVVDNTVHLTLGGRGITLRMWR